MNIVELTQKHTEAYVEFKNKAHEESEYINGTTLETTKKLIEQYKDDERRYAFIALNGNVIVGQLFLVLKNKSVLAIALISVLESEKGTGLAGKLIDKAKAIAKEQDVKRIELIVNKNNDRAIAFYKRVGFTFAKDHSKNNLTFEFIIQSKTKPIYTKW